MDIDRQQIQSAIQVVCALAEAIRTAKQIPSGHLYAMVMGKMTLEVYEGALGTLKRAKLVQEAGNMLTWVGPELEAS
jgi:hypothetical protein